MAHDETRYPFFDRDADEIEHDLWHGYTKLERDGNAPRYPLGRGIWHTHFDYGAVSARVAIDAIKVSAAVTNTGEAAAQCYIGNPGIAAERPALRLKNLSACLSRLAGRRWCTLRWRDGAQWRLESGAHRVIVEPDSLHGVETQMTL